MILGHLKEIITCLPNFVLTLAFCFLKKFPKLTKGYWTQFAAAGAGDRGVGTGPASIQTLYCLRQPWVGSYVVAKSMQIQPDRLQMCSLTCREQYLCPWSFSGRHLLGSTCFKQGLDWHEVTEYLDTRCHLQPWFFFKVLWWTLPRSWRTNIVTQTSWKTSWQ